VSVLDRLRRRRFEPRWPADRLVRFVTSFNDVFYDASGRRCVETFRLHNPGFEIWAYVEADDPERLAAMTDDLEGLGATVVDLASLPLLREFRELAHDVIPERFGGSAPESMFPGKGPQTGDIWFRKNMFRWFRKIVALDHVSRGYGEVLCWMDCDCFCKAPLPRAEVERAFGGTGIFLMKGNRVHTETGLVGYDLAQPGVRWLLEAMREHYMRREFEALPRWDDCITLDVHLNKSESPTYRDLAKRAVGHGDVLPTTILAPYLEHEKGLHSRGLGLVS
jgi:hypothetical protein